jgi:hypothetical protein
MSYLIEDELTHLPVSRQRKYQMRKKRDQRCAQCGEPVAQGSRALCLEHLIRAGEHQRRKLRLKRRYSNALSYNLKAAA